MQDGKIDKAELRAMIVKHANFDKYPDMTEELKEQQLDRTVEGVFQEDIDDDGFLTFEDVMAAIEFRYQVSAEDFGLKSPPPSWMDEGPPFEWE